MLLFLGPPSTVEVGIDSKYGTAIPWLERQPKMEVWVSGMAGQKRDGGISRAWHVLIHRGLLHEWPVLESSPHRKSEKLLQQDGLWIRDCFLRFREVVFTARGTGIAPCTCCLLLMYTIDVGVNLNHRLFRNWQWRNVQRAANAGVTELYWRGSLSKAGWMFSKKKNLLATTDTHPTRNQRSSLYRNERNVEPSILAVTGGKCGLNHGNHSTSI